MLFRSRRNSLIAQLAANSCVVGIDEIENLNGGVSVYPNPTVSSVTLESSNENPIQSVNVYSLDGRLLKSWVIGHRSLAEIDLQRLGAGIYFLDCQTEAGSRKIKVVKY